MKDNNSQSFPSPALVPELSVSDIDISKHFWVEILGFNIKFERPEDKFVYVTLEGADLMLDQIHEDLSWTTGVLEKPLGRGINLEITLSNIEPVLQRLNRAEYKLWREPKEEWYRSGDVKVGVREFLVQDPDGYLIRFVEELGEVPVAD
ncbi:bleomycin resistance protein [uncultured Psychrobacter sp.]|uniref:bleomycin resistance protein n=1 Tax=uncultured Psychrobacter sp. TaxID=259303 RepID=UPI003457E85E